MKLKTLSVVIPCHNEQEVLAQTHLTLTTLLQEWLREKLISNYELVLVNNGSTDSTLDEMLKIRQGDPRIVIVDLRANYGYQGSITAGIHHATMDMVVTIDADLQDEPARIRDMILKHYDGYDLVLGVRSDRKSDSYFKQVTASTYYWILARLGVKSIPHHGDFRLMSRSLKEAFEQFPERNRYIRAMIFDIDSKYALVHYTRKPRSAGTTKFSLTKLVSLGLDGITSYSNKPVRLVLLLGLLMFFISALGILYVGYIKIFTDRSVPGWAFISVMLLFFFGLQNFSIGIIGEYIAKVYLEAKQRPLYLVRELYQKSGSE